MTAQNSTSRSWFCVFNNPQDDERFKHMDENATLETIAEIWMNANESGACYLAFCIASTGTPHVHSVFESTQPVRFSAIKKLFPTMHLEPTKGSKKDVLDYITKRNKYAEKGEVVKATLMRGEIKGSQQGKRRDLDYLQERIDEGATPKELMREHIRFRRYEKLIKDAYYDQKLRETPRERSVTVVWLVGEPGSGKSHHQVELKELMGDEEVYVLNDYQNGGFDKYNGEAVLFMDEFRGQLPYFEVLQITDVYPAQIHARYADVVGIWDAVYIASVFAPEEVYSKMVQENQDIDVLQQLLRRIDTVVYCEKEQEKYRTFPLPMSEYVNKADLIARANRAWNEEDENPWILGDGEEMPPN